MYMEENIRNGWRDAYRRLLLNLGGIIKPDCERSSLIKCNVTTLQIARQSRKIHSLPLGRVYRDKGTQSPVRAATSFFIRGTGWGGHEEDLREADLCIIT